MHLELGNQARSSKGPECGYKENMGLGNRMEETRGEGLKGRGGESRKGGMLRAGAPILKRKQTRAAVILDERRGGWNEARQVTEPG